jgi:hypothetical protein
MHECPTCGQMCDCDGEDHGQPAPNDCCCECDPSECADEDDFDED